MWISRKVYDDLRDGKLRADTALQSLQGELVAHKTMIDWMRIRLSQVEQERAQLLFNYTGVKIATPSIEPAPVQRPEQILAALPHFNDVGDEEAQRLGIGWNPDGTLRYADQTE
jgi:hypothetical protein